MKLTKEELRAAVDKFLCYRMPDDFYPDCGITFNRESLAPWKGVVWPVGTNLLTAAQAEDMLRAILDVEIVE